MLLLLLPVAGTSRPHTRTKPRAGGSTSCCGCCCADGSAAVEQQLQEGVLGGQGCQRLASSRATAARSSSHLLLECCIYVEAVVGRSVVGRSVGEHNQSVSTPLQQIDSCFHQCTARNRNTHMVSCCWCQRHGSRHRSLQNRTRQTSRHEKPQKMNMCPAWCCFR